MLLAQDAHRLTPLVARGAVDDQHAVEMIHLVLDDARLEARGLDEDRLTVCVKRRDADVDRSLDVDEHATLFIEPDASPRSAGAS